jgi:two-component system response regulator ArlR
VRILVVEKDEALRLRATGALEAAGYEVIGSKDALDGLRKLYETSPDLIIMAGGLPMIDGEDACLRIRQASYLPIIVMGSRSEAAEMLELGADAYMEKPPSLSELVARVHVLLRRKPTLSPPTGSAGEEAGDGSQEDGNGHNGLTSTEFRLASCLMHNRGRLLDYSEIIRGVWGGKKVSLDTLHFYMRRLRQKLAGGGISMFRGVGYCFNGDGGQVPW